MSVVARAAAQAERALVAGLRLAPRAIDPALARAEGTYRGAPARAEARAWSGDAVRFARVVVVRGDALAIANLLAVAPAAVLGVDFVTLGDRLLLAADVSPLDPRASLEPFARRRAAHARLGPLASAGELPSWCARWFSPHALLARFAPERADDAAAILTDAADAFVEVVQNTHVPAADAEALRARAQAYVDDHRREDRALALLHKVFGAAWAERFVGELLFPVALP